MCSNMSLNVYHQDVNPFDKIFLVILLIFSGSQNFGCQTCKKEVLHFSIKDHFVFSFLKAKHFLPSALFINKK